MPDTRCAGRCARIYTKIADAFNTEDVAGEMAADESCESGECGGTDTPFGPALAAMLKARYAAKTADAFNTEDVPGDMAADESYESGE